MPRPAAPGAPCGPPESTGDPTSATAVPTTTHTAPRPLLRQPEARARAGCGSRSAWYRWITEGLIPRPVRAGPNTAVWPAAEIAEIVAARVAGADDEAVRDLVARLHAARQQAPVAA